MTSEKQSMRKRRMTRKQALLERDNRVRTTIVNSLFMVATFFVVLFVLTM